MQQDFTVPKVLMVQGSHRLTAEPVGGPELQLR